MKVEAITKNPQALVTAINKSMDDKILKTWKKVLGAESIVLYSHTPEQWNETAMPRPSVKTDRVSFGMSWWNNKGEPDENVKGYVLGRFTEVLMVHFKAYFDRLEVYSD